LLARLFACCYNAAMNDEQRKPTGKRRVGRIFAIHNLGVGVSILYLGSAEVVPLPLAAVLFPVGLIICWRASGEIVRAILP
jgi:hypothetical protein